MENGEKKISSNWDRDKIEGSYIKTHSDGSVTRAVIIDGICTLASRTMSKNRGIYYFDNNFKKNKNGHKKAYLYRNGKKTMKVDFNTKTNDFIEPKDKEIIKIGVRKEERRKKIVSCIKKLSEHFPQEETSREIKV